MMKFAESVKVYKGFAKLVKAQNEWVKTKLVMMKQQREDL